MGNAHSEKQNMDHIMYFVVLSLQMKLSSAIRKFSGKSFLLKGALQEHMHQECCRLLNMLVMEARLTAPPCKHFGVSGVFAFHHYHDGYWELMTAAKSRKKNPDGQKRVASWVVDGRNSILPLPLPIEIHLGGNNATAANC